MKPKHLKRYLFEMLSDATQNETTWNRIGILLGHLADIPGARLYKFRECNSNNFDALSKNSLWLSEACNFRDMMDTVVPFSVQDLTDRELMELFKAFTAAECANAYKKYPIESQTGISPDKMREFVHSCYDDEFNLIGTRLDKLVRKYYPDDYEKKKEHFLHLDELFSRRGRGKECVDWFKQDAEEGCRESLDKLRKNTYVCSLTETKDNPSMWECYAQNYKGYCIEYDFSKGVRADLLERASIRSALLQLFPMLYTSRRPPFNTARFLYEQYQDEFSDELNTNELQMCDYQLYSFYYQMLIKDPNYSWEKEWRIILGGFDQHLLYFPFATTIYLGKDISESDRNVLIEIAKKINVSVYQQTADNYRYTYQLVWMRKPAVVIGSAKKLFVRRGSRFKFK